VARFQLSNVFTQNQASSPAPSTATPTLRTPPSRRARPGDEEAPPALREWAIKLEAKPKYVVPSTRKHFPWTNSHHIADLRTGVQKLKDATSAGVLLGSGTLATQLDRLD
jgi:hypothetical protein